MAPQRSNDEYCPAFKDPKIPGVWRGDCRALITDYLNNCPYVYRGDDPARPTPEQMFAALPPGYILRGDDPAARVAMRQMRRTALASPYIVTGNDPRSAVFNSENQWCGHGKDNCTCEDGDAPVSDHVASGSGPSS